MSTIRNLSRRSVLKTAALGAGGLVLGIDARRMAFAVEPSSTAADAPTGVFQPNVYLSIGDDGKVTIVVHRSEMGQQVRTSMPMLIAEELEVDWQDIELVQAVGDAKYGNQNTDGSTSVRLNWEPLRQAGAAAREMLVQAAADKWGVAPGECRAELSRVHHDGSGRSAGYGEVASAAAKLAVPETPTLKKREDWKVIGKPKAGVDVADIVTGKAIYGYDLRMPGMLFASIERSPTIRGKLVRFDDSATRKVRGVKHVFELPAHPQPLNTNAGVAVVGEHSWATIKGRRELDVEWDHGDEPLENSAEFRKKLEEIAGRPGKEIRKEGDYEQAKASAAQVISAQFHGPYLVHAPMEPLACTARFQDGRLEVWAPTQDPQTARQRVAQALGLKPEEVTVNVTLLGGGFGRKSKPDFIIEAAQIAQKLEGTPVKLLWTREDEVQHGFYRAQNFQALEATIDDQKRVTGWRQRTVFPTITSTFVAGATEPSDFEVGMGMTNIPYRFPSLQLESAGIASDVRIGWLRSVCNTYHAHAVNCFFDEVAEAVGRDPVEYRLELLGEPRVVELGPRDKPYGQDIGRLKHVIERAAKMGRWGEKTPEGVGRGFASHFSFLTYVAMTLDASLDEEGKPRVHEVNAVVDCGTVVNPDTVVAQIEGAVVFALSYALYGEITVENGAVQQTNFNNYPLLRIDEMPKVNVEIVDSDKPPSGVGEPGVPPVSAALANALYRVTGERVRDLPLVKG